MKKNKILGIISIISVFSNNAYSSDIRVEKSVSVSDNSFFDEGVVSKKIRIKKALVNTIPSDKMMNDTNNIVENKLLIENNKIERKITKKIEAKANSILVNINDEYVFKSKEELEIENNFKSNIINQENILNKLRLDLAASKINKLKQLEDKKSSLKNDFKTYEIQLQQIIRGRIGNRYAKKTVTEAKLELYGVKQKFKLDLSEIENDIETLNRFPKKSKDFVYIYKKIASKEKLLLVTKKEFSSLKKDYFQNKLILRTRYYENLKKIKEEYYNNKKKMKVYYMLRTDTLVNQIKN